MICYINLKQEIITGASFKFVKGHKYILDLFGTVFIDSISLSQVLVNKGCVVLINVLPQIHRILETLRISHVVQIAESKEEAEELLSKHL